MKEHESVYRKKDRKNTILWDSNHVEIIATGETFYTGWGFDMHYITDEDIEQLKAGKMYHFDDGEYTHGIVYKENVDSNNATNIPLIKDEKIRKAVRAWAEANDIEDGITYLGDGEFRSYLNTTIDFAILVDEHRFDLLEERKDYAITELCGEEKEWT